MCEVWVDPPILNKGVGVRQKGVFFPLFWYLKHA
jgi:hypothetical protein